MRRRALPTVDELQAALRDAGVDDAPAQAPDAESLRGLLDLALFVAEHRKRVAFPDFRWSDPAFVSTDAKVTLRVAYTRLDSPGRDALRWALEGNLDRLRDGKTLLALDARASGIREYELGHVLYGDVTLFQYPHKPPEAADPRIDDARERGWAKTLKEHNLLPGRSLVVLDEHQGLLLRDDRFAEVMGLLILLEDGSTRLWWNPFARGADSELQYWLTWGAGTAPASGWREAFYAEERGDD